MFYEVQLFTYSQNVLLYLANMVALCFRTSAPALRAVAKIRPKRGKNAPNRTILDSWAIVNFIVIDELFA